MAAHHRLLAQALALVLLAAVVALVALVARTADDPPLAEALFVAEWPEEADEEDGDVRQQQSSACRCWSASDEAGSFFEIECKCRGQRVASVPASLPPDVHRM